METINPTIQSTLTPEVRARISSASDKYLNGGRISIDISPQEARLVFNEQYAEAIGQKTAVGLK